MSETFNNQLNHLHNYDNDYIRTIGIALGRTLHKSIRWINRFENGSKIRVLVPFYMPFVGDERYVLDAFRDDILDRRVELNTDQIPRGVIVFQNISTRSTEFANPNQYLSQEVQVDDKIRHIVSKVKAVPVDLNYQIELWFATELDARTFVTKLWDVYFNWMFFRYNYYGLPLDAFFKLPDDGQIDMPREGNMDTADNYKKYTLTLTIQSAYPLFKVNPDDLEVCDNDDEINWDYLGVPQPTKDYCKTLQAYYEANGQTFSCNFGRVFWKSYYYSLNDFSTTKPTITDENGNLRPNLDKWKKYNL
jgi:hypothetical protein